MQISPRRKLILRRCFLGLCGLVLIGLAVSWMVAGFLVSPHQRIVGDPPDNLPSTTISLDSESGAKIAGWHISADQSKGVVVLLHPKDGSRLTMLKRAELFHGAGYSIVMIDLQAHGESPGEHVTLGYLEKHDARAAVEFARSAHPNEPIAVLGVSLGGAAALLASPMEIDALVLESVFPTIEEAVYNRVEHQLGPLLGAIPSELLLLQFRPRLGISRSDIRPIDHLPGVGCPVLIMSGMKDYHTTAAETERMFSAAKEPKELWLIEDAAHEDLYLSHPEEYESRVLNFIDRYMKKN